MGAGAAGAGLRRDAGAAGLTRDDSAPPATAMKPGKLRDHLPRKRFGQHFLTDGGIIDAIVRAINPRAGDRMVEIGPGLAALTQPSVERLVAHVDEQVEDFTAVQIDFVGAADEAQEAGH